MQAKKKPNANSLSDGFFEQLRSIPQGVGKSLSQEVMRGGAETAWDQFWGDADSEETDTSFEGAPRQETIENKEVDQQRSKSGLEVEKEYIIFSQRERQIAQEMEDLRQELEVLKVTVKEVDFEIEKAIIQIPAKPGVYHLRFLQRIKRILKLIGENLADSKSWLKLGNSKKKQKGYWAQYKKKGTSFGLNNERVVATQTG